MGKDFLRELLMGTMPLSFNWPKDGVITCSKCQKHFGIVSCTITMVDNALKHYYWVYDNQKECPMCVGELPFPPLGGLHLMIYMVGKSDQDLSSALDDFCGEFVRVLRNDDDDVGFENPPSLRCRVCGKGYVIYSDGPVDDPMLCPSCSEGHVICMDTSRFTAHVPYFACDIVDAAIQRAASVVKVPVHVEIRSNLFDTQVLYGGQLSMH